MSLPSTITLPPSGLIRPIMCFSKTDFPVPLPPIMAVTSPFSIFRSTPERTLCPSKLFFILINSIIVLHHNNGGHDKIKGQYHQTGNNRRIRRRIANALGALLGIEALVAGDKNDRGAEQYRFGYGQQEIVRFGIKSQAFEKLKSSKVRQRNSGQPSGQDGNSRGENRQRRNHNHTGNEAGHYQV